jgi:hypothetical protein
MKNNVLGIMKSRMFLMRGERVLLDTDAAEIYEVKPEVLRKKVSKNLNHFPCDFMFQLIKPEKDRLCADYNYFKGLKSSPVLPFAFTETGVFMLSSVIRNKKAVAISRTLVRDLISMGMDAFGPLEKIAGEEKMV